MGRESGFAAVLTAIAILPIVLAIGLTLDLGLAYQGQMQLRSGAVAAARAVATHLSPVDICGSLTPLDASMEASVLAVASANAGGLDEFSLALDCAGDREIRATITGSRKTVLLSLAGIDRYGVSSTAVALAQIPEPLTPGQNAVPKVVIIE